MSDRLFAMCNPAASITSPQQEASDALISDIMFMDWQLQLDTVFDVSKLDSMPVLVETSTFLIREAFLDRGGPNEMRVYVKHPKSLTTACVIALRRELWIYRYLERFHHPMIIRNYGYQMFDGEKPPVFCLFFQPVNEANVLSAILERSEITLEDKVKIAFGIAKVLEFLHRVHIVHRNLKPQNVWVTNTCDVVLSDFHLSCYVPRGPVQLENASQQGTAQYMAPELWEQKGTVGTEADVYAFGVILFEMFASAGFASRMALCNSIDSFAKMICRGERPSTEDVAPFEIKNLIEQCWDGDPSQRPNSHALVEMLSSYAMKEGIPVQAPVFEAPATEGPLMRYGMRNVTLENEERGPMFCGMRDDDSRLMATMKSRKDVVDARKLAAKQFRRMWHICDQLVEKASREFVVCEKVANDDAERTEDQIFQMLASWALDEDIRRINTEIDMLIENIPERPVEQ